MNKKQLIQETARYIQAICSQQETEGRVSKALKTICPENGIFSLVTEDLSEGYKKLLICLIGETNYDWVEYWMYELDFGASRDLSFWVDEKEYHPCEMAVEEYLDIIWSDPYGWGDPSPEDPN